MHDSDARYTATLIDNKLIYLTNGNILKLVIEMIGERVISWNYARTSKSTDTKYI